MNVPDGLPSLAHGGHESGDGEACIMELVSVLAGETWSDQPSCVHPMLQTAAVIVNDHLPDDKRDLIRPLIGRFFGTNPLDGVDLGTEQGIPVYEEAVQKMVTVTAALVSYFWLPSDADVSPLMQQTTEQRRVTLCFDQLCNTLNVDSEYTHEGTTWGVAEAMVAWLSGALDVYDSAVGRERDTGREITEADVKLAQETIAYAFGGVI